MSEDTGRNADSYDVVVIGGGAGGLSASRQLARARRSVVVIDAGERRNAPATGVHALLALDGIAAFASSSTTGQRSVGAD